MIKEVFLFFLLLKKVRSVSAKVQIESRGKLNNKIENLIIDSVHVLFRFLLNNIDTFSIYFLINNMSSFIDRGGTRRDQNVSRRRKW